ncbi:MAG: hypothetical protein R3C05_14160 [Pirellulaceae bacterium]
MPLIPAAVRQWGIDAAWLNLIPASLISIAIVARRRMSIDRRQSVSSTRRLMLLAGIAMYTVGVVTTFFAFQLSGTTPAIVILMFGLLPAVLSVMACGCELRDRFTTEQSNWLRLVVNSTVLIGASLIVGLFPFTLASPVYIIMWASLCTVTATLLAITLRTPVMLYIACGTSALGLLLIGGNMMMGTAWDQAFPVWRRTVSGESAVLSPAIALVFATFTAMLRKHGRWQTPLAVSATVLATISMLLAAVVVVGPERWHGSIPSAVVLTILLIDTLLIASVGAWRYPKLVHAAGLGFRIDLRCGLSTRGLVGIGGGFRPCGRHHHWVAADESVRNVRCLAMGESIAAGGRCHRTSGFVSVVGVEYRAACRWFFARQCFESSDSCRVVDGGKCSRLDRHRCPGQESRMVCQWTSDWFDRKWIGGLRDPSVALVASECVDQRCRPLEACCHRGRLCRRLARRLSIVEGTCGRRVSFSRH